MKLVYITNEYPEITSNYGGIAVVLKNEVDGFKSKGYCVEVVIVSQKILDIHERYDYIKPFYWPGKGVMKGLRMRNNLIKYINTYFSKNDIVICMDYAGLLPFKIRPTKIVQLHESLSIKSIIQRKSYSTITYLLEYFTVLFSNKIRAVSESVLYDTNKYFPFTKFIESRVVYNGISCLIMNKVEHVSTTKNIVFIGKLSKLKGADFIAPIVNKVHESIQDVTFTIIGHDEIINGVSRKEIIINEIAFKDKVSFYNRVENAEIYNFIQKSQLLVLPSRTEALPTVVIESFSCSRPVVAFDVGGLSEMVTDGEDGYIIEAFNIDLFAKKIIKILASENLRKTLSENARKKYDRLFKFELMIDELEKFYTS